MAERPRKPARPKCTYRCHACGYTTGAYAPMERHVDTEHGHARIELTIPPAIGAPRQRYTTKETE